MLDSASIGMIIALIILIAMSAYFSATETAFTSLNRIRLKNKADNGSRRAVKALELSEEYDKLLSTILIGNNIVNNVATTIGAVLFIKLLNEESGPAVSAAVLTIVILIFGEVTPKSLAKENPEGFAMFFRLPAPNLRGSPDSFEFPVYPMETPDVQDLSQQTGRRHHRGGTGGHGRAGQDRGRPGRA